jgi:hypothetical protein
MDDEILKITIAKVRRWEGQPIDKEKLEGLRTEIFQKTKTNKFAPFSNVKKWIKAARKAIAKQRKDAEKKGKSSAKPSSRKDAPPHIPDMPAAVEAGLLELKAEVQPKPLIHTEVMMQKPPIVFDKVYLQSMTYEIASMRSAMDRISKQLDKLERELQDHGD